MRGLELSVGKDVEENAYSRNNINLPIFFLERLKRNQVKSESG
jgi:hypothetical protein